MKFDKRILDIRTIFLGGCFSNMSIVYQNSDSFLLTRDLNNPSSIDMGVMIPYKIFSFFMKSDGSLIYVTTNGDLIIGTVCVGYLQNFERVSLIRATDDYYITVQWSAGISYNVKIYMNNIINQIENVEDVAISETCNYIFYRKNADCYLYNVLTKNLRQIMSDMCVYSGSVFSDDGKYLLFNARYKVFLYNTDDHDIKELDVPNFTHANFSKSAKLIVFAYGINYFKIYNVITNEIDEVRYPAVDIRFIGPSYNSLIVYNNEVGWVYINIDVHRKQNKLLMLCARTLCPDSIFYREYFPFDMFKLIYDLI